MSILNAGFLSRDIGAFAMQNRLDHADAFEFAEALNETAHSIMAVTNIPTKQGEMDRPRVMAALLFARMLSTFQGCILLCERGLIVEARTLVRSCFETMACLAAVGKHGELAVDRMVEHTIKGKNREHGPY